jgi:prevent-host-death family protein
MEQSGAANPERQANTVGAYEAKTHLPQLLERVSKGERITITRHGVPVAVLVPAAASEQPDVRAAVEEMKRFRKGRSLKGLSIREMVEEGRRF